MFARLTVTVLVPITMVVALNQECFALWLQLWKPCNDPNRFNFEASGEISISFAVGTFSAKHTFQVTKHDDICAPSYVPGSCSRAVVGSIGDLLFKKTIFTALVGPLRVLLLNTSTVRRCFESVANNLLRLPDYKVTTDLDTEATDIVMLLEVALTFGFLFPLLLPVAALAFVLHMFAFQLSVTHQGVTLLHETSPSVRYLWWSLAIGIGMIIWMFVECGWAGRWLVFIGVPLSVVVGSLVPWLWLRSASWAEIANLKESLLPDQPDDELSAETARSRAQLITLLDNEL